MRHLINKRTGEILIENLQVRTTFWGRLVGLLFRREMEPKSGILLLDTKRVHTMGMLLPIDLFFFDECMRLIEIVPGVKPWRIPKSPKGTRHILEIPHISPGRGIHLFIEDKISILRKLRP